MGQQSTFGWHLPQIKCPLRQLKMGAALGTSKHTGHSIKSSSFSVVSIRYFLSAICSDDSDIFFRFTGDEVRSKFKFRLELELGDSMGLVELLASITISSEIFDATGLAVRIRPEPEGVNLTEELVALPLFLYSNFSITKHLDF